MKLFIKAKPSAKEERVEQTDETHFTVSVKEPPVKGQANAAIIRALARYFNISTSRVRIVAGHTSREKIAEVV